MVQNTKIIIKEITYETGKSEILAVTPQQWAGRIRRKGYKKTILSNKNLATLEIKIKTK